MLDALVFWSDTTKLKPFWGNVNPTIKDSRLCDMSSQTIGTQLNYTGNRQILERSYNRKIRSLYSVMCKADNVMEMYLMEKRICL